MSHSNVAEAESSTTRSRMRLTREGSAFLSNYARTVNSYPQRPEKQAILASLRAIPGNEAFTLEKLGSWFARHRKPSHDLHAPILLDDETILFPKLTPIHLQQLRVLHRKRSDPSEGIITFWANRLNADRAEVAAWIQYQQEKARENDVGPTTESPDIPLRELVRVSVRDSASDSPATSELPRPHLPTPAESLSPSISPRTRVPSLPPIAVKVEEPRQCLSPVSSLGTPLQPRPAAFYMHSNAPPPRSALEGLPPLSRLQQMPVQRAKSPLAAISVPSASLRVGGKSSSWQDSNMMLAATIRDSLRPDAMPGEQPPRTVDEFAEKFQEVENMIHAFMNKYDTGQLVRLGWDFSSPSRVAS